MGKPRSELEQAYRKEILAYLTRVQDVLQWSQSEIARRIGVHSSTVNKAFSAKHTLDYPKLMVLADQAGHPLPPSLVEAAKAALAPSSGGEATGRDPAKAAEDFRSRPKDWQEQFLKAIARNR